MWGAVVVQRVGDFKEGDVIDGRYRVVQVIGRGSNGVTYKARPPFLHLVFFLHEVGSAQPPSPVVCPGAHPRWSRQCVGSFIHQRRRSVTAEGMCGGQLTRLWRCAWCRQWQWMRQRALRRWR